MKWLNCCRMRLVFVGIVAAIVFGGGHAEADFVFGEPVNLGPTVNTSYWEACQSISADGLTLYFGEIPPNHDPSGYGGGDIWVTTRNTINDTWGSRTNYLPTVNTSSGEASPCISADGLSLYFASNRAGGYGSWDLWMTTREKTSDPWGEPVNLGPRVNSWADEGFPSISADGLELYFSDYMVARPGGSWDLWVTTRETKDDDWGTPVNLGDTVNHWHYDAGPFISADSLMLFFISVARPGGVSDTDDMWMTRRATDSDPWCTPVNLGPPINSSFKDGYPSFSADGSTLYFSSDRSGSWDLWQASVIPIVDFNGDGKVDGKDLLCMAAQWSTDDPLCDIGPYAWGDGIVDLRDVVTLAEHLGKEVVDSTLIAHWALDETEGGTAHETVSGKDDIVLGGAAWKPAGGQVGGTIQLDGVDDCVVTNFESDPTQGPFSVLAWVKGGAPGQVVLSRTMGANYLMADAEGRLISELSSAGQSNRPLLSETIITEGNWHRIGLVWDGYRRMLYVDGSIVAEDMQDALESFGSSQYIGTGQRMGPGTFWSGLIDDVRIYNRAVKP